MGATPQQHRGAWGERVAARRLRMHGWWVLERHYRAGGGEIDLVARRGRVFAICEVKTRAGPGAFPLVAPAQIERIEKTASLLVASRPDLSELEPRLDLILVIPRRHGPARVRHVPHGLERAR